MSNIASTASRSTKPAATLPHRPSPASEVSTAARRAGWIVTGFISLFMLFDGGARLAHFAPYVEGLVKLGYPAHLGVPIGLALVISTLLYLAPPTAVLGAILLTGYLGGATATQLRLEDPWFLFPVAFGVLTWIGLFLRDRRARVLLSL
jgi:hypothetical protein